MPLSLRLPYTACAALCTLFLLQDLPTAAAAAHKLPPSFKRCYAKAPKAEFDACLHTAVNDAFHDMKDGIPSLGVLPTDPLVVNEIKIDDHGTGPVRLGMQLTNVTVSGLYGSSVTNYSSDLDHHILYTTSITPRAVMSFNHDTTGRVLLLPIVGSGGGEMSIYDAVTDHKLIFDVHKGKDGKTHWKMNKYLVKISPKKVQMDFRGLFKQDPRLGERMRDFIRQNSMLVFEGLRGSLEEAFGALFQDVTNRIFTKVPIEDIFIFSKDPK